MINLMKHQQGATLIVALTLLILMTLFAVSSINLSTTNLRIVGNMQAQKTMEADVQDSIEQILSDETAFSLTPAATTMTGIYGNTINIAAPECIDSTTAAGFTKKHEAITPDDNTWEIVATTTDTVTGATATIHQGVSLRMLAGNCP